ncbi:MAG: PKD domain-containing protein [Methanomicrobiaceae archaeon]|nr:PKD domain-containing protein [Methanomicrobiaceae archaeon]
MVYGTLTTRYRVIVALVAVLFTVVSVSSAACTSTTAGVVTCVTPQTPGTDETAPDISGDRIVWADWQEDCQDIAAWHIGTATDRLLTPGTNESDQYSPVIWGDRVIWTDFSTLSEQLHACSLATGAEECLAGDGVVQSEPALWQDLVVWTQYEDIYLKDLATGEVYAVTEDSLPQAAPAVCGDLIAWEDWSSGYGDIVLLDRRTGTETLLTPGTPDSDQCSPCISASRIVWEDWSSGSGDIMLYDAMTNVTTLLTPDTLSSDQCSPRISGTRIVWEDWSSLYSDVMLYDIQTGKTTLLTPDTPFSDQCSPRISNTRIVWEDWEQGTADVMLLTLDSDGPCTTAGFTCDPVLGEAPLEVTFTDTSSGPPGAWYWDFGDGAVSTEQNPVHTYTESGSYTVTLDVATSVCRDSAVLPDAVTAGAAPAAAFDVNRTWGLAGQAVAFTDKSAGMPDTWHWDFGDGTVSDEPGPVHTYGAGGSYAVQLTVGNMFGTGTCTRPGLITIVEAEPGTVYLSHPAVRTVADGDPPHVIITLSEVSAYDFNPAVNRSAIVLTYPEGSGLESALLLSGDEGFTETENGTITGVVTGAVFTTGILDFSPSSPVSCEITCPCYPAEGSISVAVWANATPEDRENVRMTAYGSDFTSVRGIASTVRVEPAGVVPSSSAISMSASSDWVAEMGGNESIHIVRITDTGGEVLPTYPLGTGDGSPAWFVAHSPHGCSRFVLTSLTGSGNPFQFVFRVIEEQYVPDGPEKSSPAPVVKGGAEAVILSEMADVYPETIAYTQAPLSCNATGYTNCSLTLRSEDDAGSLFIRHGTLARGKVSLPVSPVVIVPLPRDYIPESDEGLIPVYAVDLQPDGVTFDPPARLSLHLPDDVSGDIHFTIKRWNAGTLLWEACLPVETGEMRTAACAVDHFCIFGLFADAPSVPETAAAVPATTDGSPPVTKTTAARETMRPTHLTISGSLIAWTLGIAGTYPGIIITAALLVLVLVLFIRRTRRG